MGIDPAGKPISVKKAIGVVPEVESPPSFLTGREYLQFIGLIRDINDIEKRVDY
jgi:ABC-2 type transport system ATP-binding protein